MLTLYIHCDFSYDVILLVKNWYQCASSKGEKKNIYERIFFTQPLKAELTDVPLNTRSVSPYERMSCSLRSLTSNVGTFQLWQKRKSLRLYFAEWWRGKNISDCRQCAFYTHVTLTSSLKLFKTDTISLSDDSESLRGLWRKRGITYSFQIARPGGHWYLWRINRQDKTGQDRTDDNWKFKITLC